MVARRARPVSLDGHRLSDRTTSFDSRSRPHGTARPSGQAARLEAEEGRRRSHRGARPCTPWRGFFGQQKPDAWKGRVDRASARWSTSPRTTRLDHRGVERGDHRRSNAGTDEFGEATVPCELCERKATELTSCTGGTAPADPTATTACRLAADVRAMHAVDAITFGSPAACRRRIVDVLPRSGSRRQKP